MTETVKTALIMEGGAMRGLFTCGVMDVFLENEIVFDGAAGISAGVTFGCNYKSKQIGRPLRYNIRFSHDPRYSSFRSLITSGDLYNVEFCYHTIPEELDPFDQKTFAENPMEFYIGAANVETGRMVYYKCTDGGETDIEWMRASASMPMVSRPVKIGKYTLLDGGIIDPVPYRFMEHKGYNRNVIILTQPKGFVKKKFSAMPLMKASLRKYPEIVKAMEIRHIRYNREMEEIAEREEAGTALVIRPPEALGISRTEKDPVELRRVYEVGREEAERRLEEVKAFLAGDAVS
ncbi:MAG: patatin family protein [Lachnospiraceae bacterium]|nr:patatin family protein [Lachnospiraceae bacterium]